MLALVPGKSIHTLSIRAALMQVRAREDEQIPAAQPSPEFCSQPDYAVAWWVFRTVPQMRGKLKEEGLSCKGAKEELKACNSLQQFLTDIFTAHVKPSIIILSRWETQTA